MKKYILALAISMLVVVIPAHANYWCSGTMSSLGVGNDGSIWVTGPGGISNVGICKLGAASSGDGWTADSCKAAYATLLAAKTSGQQVSIFFNDNLTCSTQPA